MARRIRSECLVGVGSSKVEYCGQCSAVLCSAQLAQLERVYTVVLQLVSLQRLANSARHYPVLDGHTSPTLDRSAWRRGGYTALTGIIIIVRCHLMKTPADSGSHCFSVVALLGKKTVQSRVIPCRYTCKIPTLLKNRIWPIINETGPVSLRSQSMLHITSLILDSVWFNSIGNVAFVYFQDPYIFKYSSCIGPYRSGPGGPFL